MSSKPLIKCIIFDMDGVLCDSEPFICKAATKMFAERYSLTVKREDFLPFVGAGEDRYLGGVAEKYGISLALPDDKERTYAIYLEIIKGRLKPLTGAIEFVRKSQKKGLKLAIVTSADEIKLRGNLQEMGLPLDVFTFCITGSDVRHKKPKPDSYLIVSVKLQTSPAHCLVVEDAPNGIQAAGTAGMRTLGLTTSFSAKSLKQAGANWIAPDLAHAPEDIFK